MLIFTKLWITVFVATLFGMKAADDIGKYAVSDILSKLVFVEIAIAVIYLLFILWST